MRFHRRCITLATLILSIFIATALAGDGFGFKCADKDCGYKPTIIFGGGMLFEAVRGYCNKCEKFQSINWTRPGAPMVKEPVAPPKPLAEVWNPATGHVCRVFKCPAKGCEGSFMEIRKREELTHCPKCGKDGFAVDPAAPRLAVD